MIKSATSGEALEAQNIILRRIALQGDVVPSRVQAPKTITEIGGYVNLLGSMNETDMQAQVLAGILGVAGPNPPLGWFSTATPLSFVAVQNDRPAGPAQPTLPLTVPVRSDFAPAVQAALKTLHDQGCQLPMLAGPSSLPVSIGNSGPAPDPMPYVGRVLTLAAADALTDPATDPLLLARATGSTGPFEIAANAQGAGSAGIAAANYQALACTETSCAPVALTNARLVPVAPILASAGFYPSSPLPQPAAVSDGAWARLTNISGLIAGQTRLGDELTALYPWNTVAESVFASMLGWRWNGSAFAATG